VSASETRILLAGDSVLAWNDGGVARALEELLGAPVESRAKNGAWIGFPELGGPIMRLSIGAQVPKRSFDWIVMNGGANDLAILCRCRACSEVRDQLISRDGKSGALPQTWAAAHERSGAKIVILGYYEGVRRTRFSGCRDALAALDARAARFAAGTDWAEFVDAGEVMTAEMLDADGIHPAPEGSVAIARLLETVLRP
jgi:lysophospholipase L1-like esterase